MRTSLTHGLAGDLPLGPCVDAECIHIESSVDPLRYRNQLSVEVHRVAESESSAGNDVLAEYLKLIRRLHALVSKLLSWCRH